MTSVCSFRLLSSKSLILRFKTPNLTPPPLDSEGLLALVVSFCCGCNFIPLSDSSRFSFSTFNSAFSLWRIFNSAFWRSNISFTFWSSSVTFFKLVSSPETLESCCFSCSTSRWYAPLYISKSLFCSFKSSISSNNVAVCCSCCCSVVVTSWRLIWSDDIWLSSSPECSFCCKSAVAKPAAFSSSRVWTFSCRISICFWAPSCKDSWSFFNWAMLVLRYMV